VPSKEPVASGKAKEKQEAGWKGLFCFPNQLLDSLEPIKCAKFPDFLQVQLGIARDQLHNIGFGFMPPGIEFQRDEMRDRDQPQWASLAGNEGGGTHGVIDRRWKAIRKIDNLHEPEWPADVNDAAQGVVEAWLAQLGMESFPDERFGEFPQLRQRRIDPEIKVFRLAHIVVGGECNGTDDHGIDFVRSEDSNYGLGRA